MTVNTDTAAPTLAGWWGRGLTWLASVDNLTLAGAREQADAFASDIRVPQWPRSRLGTLAFFAAVALFLTLVVVLKDAPGPGWLPITLVYGFLAGMTLRAVATTRRPTSQPPSVYPFRRRPIH